MSTTKIQPIHGPSPTGIVNTRTSQADNETRDSHRPASPTSFVPEENQDRFEMFEHVRRLVERIKSYSAEEKEDVFTKERIREIAERIASGFYEQPEVIEAIVKGYRKEFGI